MYKIEEKPYGFHLTFSYHIGMDEMERWLKESKKKLPSKGGEFCVFVDMREMELLPPESQPAMKEGQKLYRNRGMVRSVVILNDKVTALQFKGIAKHTGIYQWERYIDASTEPNWEKIGMAWIIDGIDPDKKKKKSKVVQQIL